MEQSKQGKVIIFSAPSGAGKSTLVNYLIKKIGRLEFSISATSRAPRGNEENGREYYFLTDKDFRERAERDEFVEWEEVYTGTLYGTLKSEVACIWNKGNTIVFDVDVKGGMHLKRIFGECALSIFVMPPSIEELERRLTERGTDSPETIAKRVAKATQEIGYAPMFDKIIVNNNLKTAFAEAESTVRDFINN